MAESTLNAALRPFEAAEANLAKAEKILHEIEAAISSGIVFGDDRKREANCMDFNALFASLPKINGWKPEISLIGLDEIAQGRLDAAESGDVECKIAVEQFIEEPFRLLREYRHRFNQKRRELVRDALVRLIDTVDTNLRDIAHMFDANMPGNESLERAKLDDLGQSIAQIDTLLGSSVPRPARWSDLHRHVHFGMVGDVRDILKMDWPSVKAGIMSSLYGEREAMPVGVDDLGELVSKNPSGLVVTKLQWEGLSDEAFERLLFVMISGEPQYENCEWLTKTHASDRGRDLSAYRVHEDALAGVQRKRIIIQCRHRLASSVTSSDIALLKEQIKHWEPPRVDILVIATSGRFTADAVTLVEKHNQTDSALMIEMWPESHLERLLAARPAMIANFGLR